jgi:hypothetical protein
MLSALMSKAVPDDAQGELQGGIARGAADLTTHDRRS